ncbi:MAG: hypothetical protein ACLRFJ_02830 [Alphaproteobacteria bacterium]
MKFIKRFLSGLFFVLPCVAVADTPVATTLGNNLTAYNGSNSTANNSWLLSMNPRTGGGGKTNATADFGNCNSLILRCAQPKCSGTGCADASVAAMIVRGCISANDVCAQYDSDGELTNYVVAQLVASSTAKANDAAIAAQNSAAVAAAQQNAQQLQQMQYQMQQMQSEMAAQNQQTVSQLQSALAQQKQLTEDALARVAEQQQQVQVAIQPASVVPVTEVQQTAVDNGISADILVRQQINGQILSNIENAEVALKTLKVTMENAFDYAGCDKQGNNCNAPKRVKVFKEKVMDFFEPYDDVYNELYDALIMAQSVGVDINDIYMMMNDACNVWGQYACSDSGKYEPVYYGSKDAVCNNGTSRKGGKVRGNMDCFDGQVVPPEDDVRCTLVKQLNNADADDTLKWDFLDPETGNDGKNIVRTGCASARLSVLPGRRNTKKSSVDIETLERIVLQDAPNTKPKDSDGNYYTQWCGVDDTANLARYVASKTLPTNNICVRNLGDKPSGGGRTAWLDGMQYQQIKMPELSASLRKNETSLKTSF